MSEWKKITTIKDMPDESRQKEYIFFDRSGNYHIQNAYEAINTYVCGTDEYDNEVYSGNPWYVDFEYTHWMELPESPNED